MPIITILAVEQPYVYSSPMFILIVDTISTPMLWQLVGLCVMGMVAFIVSTISGGGGALILIPMVSWFIGAPSTPPVINLGTFISRPSRLYLFWHDINWTLLKYYAPSAVLGAWLAGLLFSRLEAGWMQLLVGLFLLSTALQYRFGKVDRSFYVPKAAFIPLGFVTAFISTIVGGLGPILNPFYMNAGLKKEDLIATKTANSFFVGVAQISSYAFFGALTAKLWLYGMALGIGAVLGNIIGKHILAGMSIKQFRVLLIIFMMASGVVMILNSLRTLTFNF